MITVNTTLFGTLPDGREVHLYTLTNSHGWSVTLTDYGACIRDIKVPGRDGELVDVALCHGSFEDSISNGGYLGATCGRVANRIRNGRFSINGTVFELDSNYPEYILHGGKQGFSHMLWRANIQENGVTFLLRSPAGDQGFPGELDVTAAFTWDDQGRLGVDYMAITDADTIVNLTNHVYFNLNGHDDGSIEDHVVQLDCDYYLPTDQTVCVTGEVRRVSGTPMDFTTPHAIGERMRDDDPQLISAKGYDCSYVLRGGKGVRRCACVTGPKTGVVLEAHTDYPAVHLYAGNNLKPYKGKDGAVYEQYGAFCLETQLFPDFINCDAFQKHILKPGQLYHYHTDYVFSVGE